MNDCVWFFLTGIIVCLSFYTHAVNNLQNTFSCFSSRVVLVHFGHNVVLSKKNKVISKKLYLRYFINYNLNFLAIAKMKENEIKQ